MAISFNQIPSNIRIPFVGVEIDNSNAIQGPSLLAYRHLLIGQKAAAGTWTAGVPVLVSGLDSVAAGAGSRSLLYRQAKKHFANNKFTEVWALPLDDNGAGVAATWLNTITGTTTAAGTLHMYVGDEYVPIAIPSGSTPTASAVLVVAALNGWYGLPLGTVTNSVGVVTVPFTHKGEVGNALPISYNYQVGQSFPAGMSVALTAGAAGTTNPSLTTPIANLGDEWFQVVNHPYSDATSLVSLETEFASRFGPLRMIDGLLVTGVTGSYSTLTALGQTRNSPHSLLFASPGGTPVTPAYELGAAAAANMSYYGAIDPARPFQTLPLYGCLPPLSRFPDFPERNSLLYNGIATTKVGPGGVVQIDRAITTYRKNAANADDTSYLDSNTLLTLMYLRYSWRSRILQRYPRHKLADSGARIPAGQFIITPDIMRAEAVSWFADMENLGLVENSKLFEQNLQIDRNADRNRLDVVLPPDIINQLVVTATRLSFIL